MRIIGDTSTPESFIPGSGPRSIKLTEQAFAAMQSGEIVGIAASYLAEHRPGSPELAAYLADQDTEDEWIRWAEMEDDDG